MKLKCDLIVQNLNQINHQQSKLYKSAYVGLYRPKLFEDSADSYDDSSDKASLILTVEHSELHLKYKLTKIEALTRFVKDGKATLKLIDQNVFLLISNSPPLTLTNFISFLNVKLSKTNQIVQQKENGKPVKQGDDPNKYVNKLLSKVKCEIAASSLNNISPLTEKDVNDALKARHKQVKQDTESPIRASSGSFKRPTGTSGGTSLARSYSTSSLQTNGAPKSSMLQRSSSSSDLLVQLTDEQSYVLKLIKSNRSVFLTGSGGTGKSFLINIIKKSLNSESCFVTASTGVAASLINGITIHAFAGFTLNSGTDTESRDQRMQHALNRVLNAKEKLQNWKKCQHLIIDEISMIDADYFDCLDFVARSVRGGAKNDKPFGGIQLILSGDFLQLPPVSKQNEEKKKFCFQAKCWSKSIDHTVQLTKIKRQSDTTFIDLLEEIRFGKCTPETVELFDKIKKDSSREHEKRQILPTKLCTHKDDVEFINKRELDALTGPKRTYDAIDTNDNEIVGNSPHFTKIMNTLSPAPQQLTLKLNSQVMLIKNLNVGSNLVNGARGTVIAFDPERNNLPVVRFMNGVEMTMKYDSWSYRLNSSSSIVCRKQVPLQLAWAISIHKSQGMTLDCAEISLSRVFECGQAYVGLSRVKSLDSLRIIDFEPTAIRANETVLKFYQKLKNKGRGDDDAD